MNKQIVERIIENFGPDLGVEWKTQDSKINDILFYRVPVEEESQYELAKSRLREAKYKFLVLKSDKPLGFENEICVNEVQFETLKQMILDRNFPLNENIKFIGITGTNGKTTTVDLVRQIAINNNINIITVGTLGVYLNNEFIMSFGLTTPSYIDLHKILFKFQDRYELVAMELSSHALSQRRIGKILFDAIGWTNFTQDHLDYHKTMGEYFEAKKISFQKLKKSGKYFIPKKQRDLIKNLKGYEFEEVDLDDNFKNPFLSISYNLQNYSLATSMLKLIYPQINCDANSIVAPPGRANIFEYEDSLIVIDYAHTPDAIESVARELKQSFPEKELIVLFGCGGDRDKSKRPLMAQAAEKYAKKVILTSDNPRFEDPQSIINDIKIGFESNIYEIIVERKESILKALSMLNRNVLLIAGKGHEEYLDIKGIKEEYSDIVTVKDFIND